MRHIQIFGTLLILNFNLWGQITPLYSDLDGAPGAYYKDVDNFHDAFLGTWKYENGNTLLEIKLTEWEKYYVDIENPFYEDFVVGEVRYVENGIEKVNTFFTPSSGHTITPYISPFDYALCSIGQLPPYMYPKCPNCGASEMRLIMDYKEPLKRNVIGLVGALLLRPAVVGSNQALIAQLDCASDGYGFDGNGNAVDSALNTFSLPCVEYVLIKQP